MAFLSKSSQQYVLLLMSKFLGAAAQGLGVRTFLPSVAQVHSSLGQDTASYIVPPPSALVMLCSLPPPPPHTHL